MNNHRIMAVSSPSRVIKTRALRESSQRSVALCRVMAQWSTQSLHLAKATTAQEVFAPVKTVEFLCAYYWVSAHG